MLAQQLTALVRERWLSCEINLAHTVRDLGVVAPVDLCWRRGRLDGREWFEDFISV